MTASDRHVRAFDRSVRARSLEAVDMAAPMIELGRDLARLIDRDGITVRPLTMYRAVLSELRRYPRG
ncbi:hypothetical protein ACFXQA_10045 [Microbacterium sp. P07]|uniref:hypothetical protein n=1 Tax=Microbacterium sp. P07 TaxID=3366952 RepID=UPI003747683D